MTRGLDPNYDSESPPQAFGKPVAIWLLRPGAKVKLRDREHEVTKVDKSWVHTVDAIGIHSVWDHMTLGEPVL